MFVKFVITIMLFGVLGDDSGLLTSHARGLDFDFSNDKPFMFTESQSFGVDWQKIAESQYNSDIERYQSEIADPKQRFVTEMLRTIEYVKMWHIDDYLIINDMPVDIIMSQAILETGYGQSYSARKRLNYFGLTDGKGNLRTFTSMKDCVLAYYMNLEKHRAYSQLRASLEKGETDIYVLVPILAKPYAEDPQYSNKVLSVARRIDI